ncbi:MAG: hypothetical protein ACREH8_23210 [Opitutaceae bacterium]
MLRVILLAVLFAGIRCHAADVEFLRVWPGWRGAEAFDRISEYFGGREHTGRQLILRTQPDVRAGYYFLVRVKSTTALERAKFELSVIRPDAPEPKIYRFEAAVPPKETVIQLGLTGSDWPGGDKANPVAWKLALVGADGRVFAEQKSFLWEKPAR